MNKSINIDNIKIIATNGYIPIIDVNDKYITYIVKIPVWIDKTGKQYEIHNAKLYIGKNNEFYFKYVNGLRYYLSEFILWQ